LSGDQWLAEASWVEGNIFLGSDTSGHTVVYDSTEGTAKGIGPMKSLLTSLAACTGMDIVAILKKRKQRLKSLKVLVKGERPEHGLPKPWTTVHIKYVLSGENLEVKFIEEAIKESNEKFCSVGANLQPTTKITHDYEILP